MATASESFLTEDSRQPPLRISTGCQDESHLSPFPRGLCPLDIHTPQEGFHLPPGLPVCPAGMPGASSGLLLASLFSFQFGGLLRPSPPNMQQFQAMKWDARWSSRNVTFWRPSQDSGQPISVPLTSCSCCSPHSTGYSALWGKNDLGEKGLLPQELIIQSES